MESSCQDFHRLVHAPDNMLWNTAILRTISLSRNCYLNRNIDAHDNNVVVKDAGQRLINLRVLTPDVRIVDDDVPAILGCHLFSTALLIPTVRLTETLGIKV